MVDFHNHKLRPTFKNYPGFPYPGDLGFPGGSDNKTSVHGAGDQGSIPGLGRKRQPAPVYLPGKSHGWRDLVGYTVHGVTKSQTRLSDFTFQKL